MKTHLLAIIVFWIFLALMFLTALIVINDTSGLLFVLGTLGAAFTLVTIGDWLFDRCDAGHTRDELPGHANDSE